MRVCALAVLLGAGPARADPLPGTDQGAPRLPVANLFEDGRNDTVTLRVDEKVGMEEVSLIDPATDNAVRAGAFQQLDASVEAQPRWLRGVTTRFTVGYHRTDYLSHGEYSWDSAEAGIGLSAPWLGGVASASAGFAAVSEGGQRVLDNYTLSAGWARKLGATTLVADYHFTRTAYHVDRANADLHQATLLLMHAVGGAGSYGFVAVALSRQRAVRDQLYLAPDPLGTAALFFDTAYRPFDYWGQAVSAALRRRDVLGNPLVTGGADLAYQHRAFSHVDYQIDPINGARRGDDEVNLGAFVQYRLSRHLYGRMTLSREDTFSNLAMVTRHGQGASLGLRWRASQ